MKHILYPTISSASSIGGIPRVALIVLVSIIVPMFLVIALSTNPLFATVVGALLFAIGWVIMKIISFQDPDYILILVSKIKNLKKREKYVA